MLFPMKVNIIPVTAFMQNCSILLCEQTGRAAVVDPGGDIDQIASTASQMGATLDQIWLTHGHLDHAGGAGELAAKLDIPIIGPHIDDKFLLESFDLQATMFGFPPCQSFTPDRWLEQGDQVQVGELVFDVRHCPGHTPGHVVFVDQNRQLVTVGDVLFNGSIGRTDFPRGDHATLLTSIRDQLMTLDDQVQFIPGHGPTSTIGAERRGNPYIRSVV